MMERLGCCQFWIVAWVIVVWRVRSSPFQYNCQILGLAPFEPTHLEPWLSLHTAKRAEYNSYLCVEQFFWLSPRQAEIRL